MKQTSILFALVLFVVLFSSCGSNDCANCVTQEQFKQAMDSVKKNNGNTAMNVSNCTPTVITDKDEDADAMVTLDENISQQYLGEIQKYSKKLNTLSDHDIWRQGATIGTNLIRVGNRMYEFFVSPEDKYHESEIWIRYQTVTKETDDDFPKQRVYFKYDHSKQTGYLVSRIYKTAGQGYLDHNAESTQKTFKDMLGVISKVIK